MKHTFLTIGLLIAAITALNGCKKDAPDPPPTTPDPGPQFIADNSSFQDFFNWSLDATQQGADPGLGEAHGGNDESVTRNVFFKDGQDPVNGAYPVGTIIVKHSTNPGGTVDERTAMVKRGGNYDPDFGNWEFFMLTPEANIALDPEGSPMRGNLLMGGMCRGCHTGAQTDHVFSK